MAAGVHQCFGGERKLHAHRHQYICRQNTAAILHPPRAVGGNATGPPPPPRQAVFAHGDGEVAKDTLSTNLRIADSNGRSFIKSVSAWFSETISEDWNAAWATTGFPDQSTAIPTTQDARLTLLDSLNVYFTKNPAMEVDTSKGARKKSVWL
jgi:hypothetical protein